MTARSEPLVSVVIPFYNTERYLAECIESVLRQSYQRWECVLVNNCSTDGSDAIAKQYAARDHRLRVVHNTTLLNQVQNYNVALGSIAEDSVFTKMVEADNWIYPDCLTQMVALAAAHPRMGLVSAYCVTERTLRFIGLPLAASSLPGRQVARMHFLEDAYLFGAPTTVLLRSSIVRSRKPFFDESTWLVEDLSAFYEILAEWDFGFVHQVLTFVRTDNDGSIQSGRRGYDAMALDRMAVLSKHGRLFLDPNEYRDAFRRTKSLYYDRLAAGFLARKGAGFWKYHRDGLATFGARLERSSVARQVGVHLLRMIGNPGSTAKALIRTVRDAFDRRRVVASRVPSKDPSR